LLVHVHAGACTNSEAGPKGVGQDARSQREVPKRKRHPTWRLPGIGQLLLRCLNSGIHAVACSSEKESTSLSTPAARPVVPDSPPHRGPGYSSGPSWPALGVQPRCGRESKKRTALNGYSDEDDVRFRPILLKNSVLTNRRPNFGSRRQRQFDSVQICTFRPTESDCRGRIFSLRTSSNFRSEFFNTIGQLQPVDLFKCTPRSGRSRCFARRNFLAVLSAPIGHP
jgi:hypothetical protein